MLNTLSLKQKHAELVLLAVAAALLALATFGPDLTQPAHQHAFADIRVWANIPYAMDVLSNAAFALWGSIGLLALRTLRQHAPARKPMPMYTRMHRHMRLQRVLAALFFMGLLFTAAASAFYHLRPVDAGLCVDRLGMVVAFAGLLGLATCGHVSPRAGAFTAAAVLLLGPASIWFWLESGNVLPWLAVQFGGMVLVVLVAFLKPLPGALHVRWGIVIFVYALAKLLELADHEVYALTDEVLSGHSLKHLVASLAAWPIYTAVRSLAWPALAPGNAAHLADVQNRGRIRVTNFDTGAR